MSAPTNQTAARRPAAPKASSRVTQYVDQQLERTRRQVKSTDLIAAGLLLVVMVIGFFLLAAIIDAWVFTLTPMMRWIAFLGLIAGCVSMLVFSIWPLLTKKINPDYAAKMLEDSKPGFRNSVLNYVWFRKKPDGIRSAVFDAVARQAAVDLNSVPADSSVDRSKVIRLGFWLVGMTAAFIVYFMLSPKNPFQTLNRVMFPAADLAKPAVVTIADVTPGNTSVFFGDQVEITAKVYGQHSPEDVQLIYSTNDGRQSGQVMVMQPDPTTPRQYKIDLTKNTGGLRESLEYEIVARDGQTGKFEIKVAPRPAITIESIQIQPPKYTKLKPQTTLQGAIDGVEGATVILRATANLEIENATIELLNQLPTAPNEDQKFKLAQAPLDMKVESKSAQRTFQLTLDSNREKPMATHYRLNFRSVTGKSPATPNVYPIRIIPDLAPELEVRNPTAPESKVPANGRLAVVATANDLDYEISFIQINVEHRGNQIRSKKLPLKIQAENGRKAQARFEIKPEELGLSVGDQAIFYLTAGDNRTTYFNDDPSPNVTRSKNYSFTVTEPKKSPDGKSPSKTQDPPPSDSDTREESNQSGDKQENGESSDTSDNGDSGSNDDERSNEGDKTGDQGDPDGGGEPSEDNTATDPEQKGQPDQSDTNQPDQGSPEAKPEQGTEGTSDPETKPSDSQDANNPEGNQDSTSAPEDGGSGTTEQSPQDSASKSNGGNESAPDGGDPENKGDGSGGDERPSDADPNTDASSAGQGSDATDNDVSDTAPEKRDENLTEGDEQLSKDASEAEQVRQLDKLTSENRERRERPGDKDQENPQQEPIDGETPEGDENNTPENPQSQQEDTPSTDPNKESEQSPGSGNQSNNDRQQQDPTNAEQSPNSEGADPKDSDTGSPNNSQETDSPDSKSSSEGSPKPNEGGSAKDPQSKEPNAPQDPAESSPEPSSEQKSGEPDSGKPDSGQPNNPDSKASNESPPSDPSSTPGDEPAKQEGQPAETGQPSESSSPKKQSSDKPGDQPLQGSPSGKPSDPGGESKPGERPSNDGDRKASDGDVGTEALRREKENLEYSQKKIDLLLDDLRKQRHNPNEELLRKMNWDKQDLNDFIDSWDEMEAAAEQGDEQAKLALKRRRLATGLRPDSKRRAVAGNEEDAGVLNQIGVVNEPPPEERHNFNLFLQDLQRARP